MVSESNINGGIVFVVPLAFFLAAAGAWFMSRYAYRFGLLDIPNDRSSHNLPTPRGGGIGILAAFIASSFWLRLPLFFWLPATLLSLVSFFDDKLCLTAKSRLVFQFLAAFIIVISGTSEIAYPLPANLFLVVSLVIFIAGTANLYNFMDGINGIAGITGTVGFGLLALFARASGAGETAYLLPLAVMAACVGFLPFNLPIARVFLGDVGSILLGFLFAVLCIVNSHSLVDFLTCCGFLSTFYADTLSTLFIRWRDGERLSRAHRRHLYQLLANQLKIPHWQVSAGYGVCQLVAGFLLIAARGYGLPAVLFVIAALAVAWTAVSRSVRRRVDMQCAAP